MMQNIIDSWLKQLYEFREQGIRVTDINPIAALADVISEQLYHTDLTQEKLMQILQHVGKELWAEQCQNLRHQTGVAHISNITIPDMSKRDITQPLYRAVFTAHPVFALRHDVSMQICRTAEENNNVPMPDDAYGKREKVTLQQEHVEAMSAVRHARDAINHINDLIFTQRQTTHKDKWRHELPQMLGVSTWVGYDLDGRSDISWADSFRLRLSEKAMALEIYLKALQAIKLTELDKIIAQIDKELRANGHDIERFDKLTCDDFVTTVNALTEREDKLVSSHRFSDELLKLATNIADDDKAKEILVIAADIRTHGFGMGEVHLRINALQIHNAMRLVDDRAVATTTDGMISSHSLMDKLSSRIINEKPWTINFKNLDNENATARRQLMLAAQFLKHIDSDQPIRLLIAECEKPLTLMSALYLTHKLGIADKLDISPLFETSYGLEHGEIIIEQLLAYDAYIAYIKKRQRLAVQTGFSDAGRFVGQIAANMAIERLQIKIAQCLENRVGKNIALLLFNTHGESLGRGGVQGTMAERQNFILTPFARHKVAAMGVPLYHQSSFQGGDGYRLFGTPALALATVSHLFNAELADVPDEWLQDPFYQKTNFSLDLFLSLKNWHETLFSDPTYSDLLFVFGNNLLPKTGSRPTKRVVQTGSERTDPSKIRAIPHNAILQQMGYLANVISGMGSAAILDRENFVEIYQQSPRLQQCLNHIKRAKRNGSLNTVLAYSRLIDAGFWVNRAYYRKQPHNQKAFRQLGQHLRKSVTARGIRHNVWRLRDDLIDLYRIVDKVENKSIRVTDDERGMIDLLHAIRIATIMDSLILLCHIPNLAESNQYSNTDILTFGLKMDFTSAKEIIRASFTLDDNVANAGDNLAEAENYSANNTGNYGVIDEKILAPLEKNHRLILTISHMISAHYGAHG